MPSSGLLILGPVELLHEPATVQKGFKKPGCRHLVFAPFSFQITCSMKTQKALFYCALAALLLTFFAEISDALPLVARDPTSDQNTIELPSMYIF